MKKRLTQAEEFEILKLVLDKFLWLGFGIMAYGFYLAVSGRGQDILHVLSFLISGAVILMLFMFLLVREYEVVK